MGNHPRVPEILDATVDDARAPKRTRPISTWLSRQRVVIATTAGLGLIVSTVLLSILLPNWLHQKVIRSIEERGLSATLGSVRWTWTGIALHELRLRHHDHQLTINILRPDLDLWTWLSGEGLPLEGIEAEQITLRDTQGQLATLRTLRLQREGTHWAVQSHDLQSHMQAPLCQLKQLQARFLRRPYRLQHLRIAHGDCSQTTFAQTQAWLNRVRDWLKQMRPQGKASSTQSAKPAPTDNGNKDWRQHLAPKATLVIKRFELPQRWQIRSLRVAAQGKRQWQGNARMQHPQHGTLHLMLKRPQGQSDIQLRLSSKGIATQALTPLLPQNAWMPELGQGHLRGDITLRGNDWQRLRLQVNLKLSDVELSAHALGTAPTNPIDLHLGCKGTLDVIGRNLELEKLELGLGNLRAHGHAGISTSQTATHFKLTLALPTTDCDRALHTLPPAWLDQSIDFSLAGNLQGHLQLDFNTANLDATLFELDVSESCTAIRVPEPFKRGRLQQRFRYTAYDAQAQPFTRSTGPKSDTWTALDRISPYLIHAILAHEDAAFFRHRGFAPWAIRDALVHNIKAKRFVLGASTISMQLAKNLFLQRDKTLARKIQEVILTWWLEEGLSKESILELYLNVIEYGPEIYGIKQAAAHYFKRAPADLSPAESVFLATLLPSPVRAHAQYSAQKLWRSTRTRMQRLLQHMAKRGRIDTDALNYGMQESLTLSFTGAKEGPPPQRIVPGKVAPIDQGNIGSQTSPTWHDPWLSKDMHDPSPEQAIQFR